MPPSPPQPERLRVQDLHNGSYALRFSLQPPVHYTLSVQMLSGPTSGARDDGGGYAWEHVRGEGAAAIEHKGGARSGVPVL